MSEFGLSKKIRVYRNTQIYTRIYKQYEERGGLSFGITLRRFQEGGYAADWFLACCLGRFEIVLAWVVFDGGPV